jgi:N-acetylmuramoyl-L-alanine amidase
MYIAPESGHDWRLVLDLAPASKAEFEHLAAESAAKAQPKVVEAKPAPKTVTQTQAQAEPPKITVPQPEPPKPAVVPKPEVPKLEAKGLTPKAESPPLPQASMAPVKPAESAHGQTAPADVKKPDIKIAMATPPPAVASLVRPPVAPKLEPKLPPSVLPPPRPDAPIRPVIVIDAGHGGADPGAQATDGTKEKDIVLNAALAVAKALEKSGRYSVVLTRSTDTTLKLRERVDVSRANHGDLFVSLHANLFEKSAAVSGLSIYTLSDRATSKAAAELASKENRADLIAGVDLSHENDDVTHILIDLAQHETLNRSVQFAHQLVETVQRTTPLEKNTGQQASLVVLKAPDVPSVLVELGYLTNDADLARMKSDVWIGQFADAFVAAVDRHFQIKNARRDEPAVLR